MGLQVPAAQFRQPRVARQRGHQATRPQVHRPPAQRRRGRSRPGLWVGVSWLGDRAAGLGRGSAPLGDMGAANSAACRCRRPSGILGLLLRLAFGLGLWSLLLDSGVGPLPFTLLYCTFCRVGAVVRGRRQVGCQPAGPPTARVAGSRGEISGAADSRTITGGGRTGGDGSGPSGLRRRLERRPRRRLRRRLRRQQRRCRREGGQEQGQSNNDKAGRDSHHPRQRPPHK